MRQIARFPGPSRRRTGFTLIELMVVIAIMAILIGMMLAGVQRVRQSAARAICQNNLKQIGLAFANCDTAHGRMPPGIGWFPGEVQSNNGYGTAGFHLLQYLEQDALYSQSKPYWASFHFTLFGDVRSKRVQPFICPADPSVENGGYVTDITGELWGASSYAVNAQVFCQVEADGRMIHPQGRRGLASISDGLSNTILVAEKYAHCTNQATIEGGSAWAYSKTGQFIFPLHSAFAVSWDMNYTVGPNSKFQYQPQPNRCDPFLASTAHQGGIQVALADGSARTVASSISGQTWWATNTPGGGEQLSSDW